MFAGIYSFPVKKSAFRNDFCVPCNRPRRAVRVWSLLAIHMFWVPVFPLGIWPSWRCAVCECGTHDYPQLRFTFKGIGLAILGVLLFMFWMAPPVPGQELLVWGMRIGSMVGLVAILTSPDRSPLHARVQEELAKLPPATDNLCPFCQVPLISIPECRCPKCGILRT